MLTTLFQSLSIASGGMLSIGSILLILLLLSSPNGLRKAIAYFSGYSTSYALIGIIMLLIGHHVEFAHSNKPSLTGSIIFVVLGTLFLFVALRKWRNPPTKETPPPKIFKTIDSMSAQKTFLIGAMIAAINFKNLAIYLSAVSVLVFGKLSLSESLISLFFVLLLFNSSVLTPIVLYIMTPKHAPTLLAKIKHQLETHNYLMSIIILSLFGSLFLLKGIYALYQITRPFG